MSDINPGQSVVPPAEPLSPPAPPAPPLGELPAPRPTKLRIVAIVLFVLGLILAALGVGGVLPGGIGTGAAFAVWGIILFAFSFIPLPRPSASDEPPLPVWERLLGTFYQPTRVFKNLRSNPRWLAAFLVVATITAIYSIAFFRRLTPEVIVNYTMDKLEQSPIKPPPDRMAQAKEDAMQQAKQPVQRVQTVAKSYFNQFLLYSFVGALCMLGVLVFGGRINFWQSFAAVIHAALPVVVVQKLLSLLLLYIKDPADIHPILNQEGLVQDNLGFFFAPADHPVLFVLGSAIGVLSFYGLWLRAKALMNAGYKVSSAAGWGTSISLLVLGLMLGAIFATLFSSFMS